MLTLNATDVRKEFSSFIDTVVREKPVAFTRNRDQILAMSIDQIQILLQALSFHINWFEEDDGTITASLEEIDIVVNAENMDKAKRDMANELIEYSSEYLNNYRLYSISPNRRMHFPYVIKISIQKDIEEVIKLLDA